jgi:hypothetical protein
MQKGNSLVEERWNGGENFADAAYPRKCSGGGFGEGAESLLHNLQQFVELVPGKKKPLAVLNYLLIGATRLLGSFYPSRCSIVGDVFVYLMPQASTH